MHNTFCSRNRTLDFFVLWWISNIFIHISLNSINSDVNYRGSAYKPHFRTGSPGEPWSFRCPPSLSLPVSKDLSCSLVSEKSRINRSIFLCTSIFSNLYIDDGDGKIPVLISITSQFLCDWSLHAIIEKKRESSENSIQRQHLVKFFSSYMQLLSKTKVT